MGLSEALANQATKKKIVQDCTTLIEEEVASKGFAALLLKAEYKAIKRREPQLVPQFIEQLLPEFACKLDPIWAEGAQRGTPAQYFRDNRAKVADALLSVTDARAQKTNNALVWSTYVSLRSTAKKYLEDAIPNLSKVIEKYA